MLRVSLYIKCVHKLSLETLPMVNVIQNPVCLTLSMLQDEVFFDPAYQMILECSLDHLME